MAFEPYGGYQMNPYSFNPMLAYQAQLQNMNQQPAQSSLQQIAQQNQQQNQQPQYQVPTLKGRAVTGIDEARAAQIDFDGSVHYFSDVANGKIYTKQLGMNGTAVFNIYALQQPEVPVAATAIDGLEKVSTLEKRIGELETKIKKYEGMIFNGVQSDANNGASAKQRKSNADNSESSGKQS